MLSIEELNDLYIQYGFEAGPHTGDYAVYYSQNGYFQNAEIVLLNKDFNKEEIDQKAYEDIGYSVRIRTFEDINSAHEELFKGFFKTTVSNRKLNAEYLSFCEQQQAKLLTGKYEYISGNYIEDGAIKDGNIISHICEIFNSEKCELIILEASAGYGKTCTSFEVIKTLIEKFPLKIPLMAELSKNRKASVFRYVLLSEIDQKFPALSSELVTNEIYSGRIFLIIDGFDELLSKSYLSLQEVGRDVNKEAQTMLDTIAQLLPPRSKTKILLTTRKSSIFVGESFNSWVEEHLPECSITRLQISAPSLRDWIGPEKAEILKKNGIDLCNILNPVLLTLLRNETVESISENYPSNEKIIEKYLDLLLKREQTRQALTLTTYEQLDIVISLAAQMVQYDISSEDIEFIRSVLKDIVSPRFDEFQKRYEYLPDAENKPSEEEFVNKLSHHALLDRVSSQSNQIGFINDFIFGFMIAKAVITGKLPPSELKGKYLDLAITSYSANSTEQRVSFYRAALQALTKEPPQRQLCASMSLLGKIEKHFSGEYFEGIFFGKQLDIIEMLTFQNCVFINCIFSECHINTDAFKTCQFYNCSFYDNQIIQGSLYDCELVFLSCIGHEDFAQAAYKNVKPADCETISFERIVLEQFWKPGYDSAEPRRAYQTLLRGVAPSNKQSIAAAIDSLVKKELLLRKMRVYELNFEKIDEIKDIIGR